MIIAYFEKKQAEAQDQAPANSNADAGQIQGMHPDLANAPVYPTVLAGLMKTILSSTLPPSPNVFNRKSC